MKNMRVTDTFDGATETIRQFSYIEKAKEHVSRLADQLGRKPTCCVTTFGCQMNVVREI